MPNYNLVVTAGYKPYTFDELAKPLMMYKQEYEKYQDAINTMQDNASMAKYYIDENLDKEMLQTHQQYMDDVRALSDELAGGAGLTAETTSRALALRRRFAKDIAPMLKAAQERDAEVKEQRQALLKNPNLIFSRDAMSTPISEYMKATRDPYALIDLAELQKEAMTKSAAISATYPEHTELADSGKEGWVIKRKYTGPSDYPDYIMSEIENSNWDGESDYKGKYKGYAALRKSLYDVYDNDKYGNNRDKIRAAINAGIRTGIVSKVDEELAHDPTYDKSGSGSKKGGSSLPQIDALHMQETNPVMTNVVTDKEKKGISYNLRGLNELTPEAAGERGKLLNNPDKAEMLGFTTSKLDEIYSELLSYTKKHKKEADEARQKAASLRVSPQTRAAISTPANTPNWGAASMYGAIGQSMNMQGDNAAQELIRQEKIYKRYDSKVKELSDKYFTEAQKVLNSKNLNLYKNYDEEPFSYAQLKQYKEDLDSDNVKSRGAETFALDSNMKKTLLSGLKWTTGTQQSGLVNVKTGKSYSGANLDKVIDTSKDIYGAIEYVDGRYEFIIDGKDGEKYIVRGSGYLNFAETAGKKIEFLNTKVYDTKDAATTVKLPQEFNDIQNFNTLYNSLSIYRGYPLSQLGITQISQANLQPLGTEGGRNYYGIKFRNSEGKVINVVVDDNMNIEGVMNPEDSRDLRNTMVHDVASKWFGTYKADAYKNYGDSQKFMDL